MRIFISYRRDDGDLQARLIYAELVRRFGATHVFLDTESIEFGDNFRAAIDARLAASDVVVAVIGARWVQTLHDRANTEDYVRYEISQALERGLRIVPVLVANAEVPSGELPASLSGLRSLNYLSLNERALRLHLTALVEAVQGHRFEAIVHNLHERSKAARRAQLTGFAVGLVIFLAWSAAAVNFYGVDKRLASTTMWLGSLGTAPAWSGDVVLVAIDHETERAVGRPFGPSWRSEHARLIGALSRAGARVVAFDLFLERPTEQAIDQALEDAVRASPPTTVVFEGVST